MESGVFPGELYSPYFMKDDEKATFENLLKKDEEERELQHEDIAKKLTEADEYELLKLYGDGGSSKSS